MKVKSIFICDRCKKQVNILIGNQCIPCFNNDKQAEKIKQERIDRIEKEHKALAKELKGGTL